MNCCNNILNLGTFGAVNDSIKTGIKATVAGNYTLQFGFAGCEGSITKSFQVNDDLNFPTDIINEDYEFKAIVLDADKNPVKRSLGGVDYDCFLFTIKMQYAL